MELQHTAYQRQSEQVMPSNSVGECRPSILLAAAIGKINPTHSLHLNLFISNLHTQFFSVLIFIFWLFLHTYLSDSRVFNREEGGAPFCYKSKSHLKNSMQ
jgi:hypothetical protein